MRRTTTLLGVGLALASLALGPLTRADVNASQRAHLQKADVTPSVLAARAVDVTGETVNGVDGVLVDQPCVDGLAAGVFTCDGVDLLSFLPRTGIGFGGGQLSDVWGWTDPETGDEIVIAGTTTGTVFVRITDPTSPEVVGFLPNPGATQRIWHDIKTDGDFAFIVSESVRHGMLVVDMTRFRELDADPKRRITPDAVYDNALDSHNIVINEEADIAYLVGTGRAVVGNVAVTEECLQGLHMVDISDPLAPTFAGCHLLGVDPYVHDAHCVTYRGPDVEHRGKDICINAAEESVQTVDVSNPLLPLPLGLTTYADFAYIHQGWLTEDQAYFLLGDELDEDGSGGTRTLVFDVRDLDRPVLIGEHFGPTKAIDHNMYTLDGLVYQSNYEAGLRIQDTVDVAEGELNQVAFFDTYPDSDDAAFNGTWSNYPYFASGVIPVTGIGEGLFLLRVQDDVLAQHARPVAPAQ